jgi:hypothetical protein
MSEKLSPSDIKRILYPKDRSNIIERGKKKFCSIKHRHRINNEKKISRYFHTKYYHKIHKPWRMITRRFISKSGRIENRDLYFIFSIDSRSSANL